MQNQNKINTHINRVNEELAKLSHMIEHEKELETAIKAALIQSNHDDSAEIQKIQQEDLSPLSINVLNSQVHFRNEGYCSHQPYAEGHLISIQSDAQTYMIPHQFHLEADTTVKKFHPIPIPHPKLQPSTSQQLEKGGKKQKSAAKLPHRKTASSKKSNKFISTQASIKKSPYLNINPQLKKLKSKTKMPLCNKTATSNKNKINQSVKLPVHLQKEISMKKITDLKMQKNLCDKESEYLSYAIKMNHEYFNELIEVCAGVKVQDTSLSFMVKSMVNFFTRNKREQGNEPSSINQIIKYLRKPEYIISLILQLPDILRKKNVISKQRCNQFFRDFRICENHTKNMINVEKQTIYLYLKHLYLYLEYLLNNNVVKQTDRDTLLSERYHVEKKNRDLTYKKESNLVKQYDSQRRIIGKSSDSVLKRISTHKFLSPKHKRRK